MAAVGRWQRVWAALRADQASLQTKAGRAASVQLEHVVRNGLCPRGPDHDEASPATLYPLENLALLLSARRRYEALFEEHNRGELTVEQTARKVGFRLPTPSHT